MKRLYFDCFAGISGDMAVAAMIALGVDWSFLQGELAKLDLPGCSVAMKSVVRSGIEAVKFDVEQKDCLNDENLCEIHERNIDDIFGLIRSSSLDGPVKDLAMKIFTVIGEAEAAVHGKKIHEIHFHEVGAVDSIIDIVAFSICFCALNP
ncbi:MAG: nickel insertion protein, partial [Spirochaetota bacterium]